MAESKSNAKSTKNPRKIPPTKNQQFEEDQKELLRQIGLKEKELEEMLLKARRQAEKKIESAQKEAERLIEKGKETISNDLDKLFQGGLDDVEQQVKEIVQSAEKRSKLIKKKASDKIEIVAGKIMESLLPSSDTH